MPEPVVEVTYQDLVYLVGLKETELSLLKRKVQLLEAQLTPTVTAPPPSAEPSDG